MTFPGLSALRRGVETLRRMTLHWGRLGMNSVAIGYRHDFVARHWWVDIYYWRFCLIKRHAD